MFIPFGDYPNPPKPQWVTRILLALNVAVHLLFAVVLNDRLDAGQRAEQADRIAAMWAVQAPAVRADYEEMVRQNLIRRVPPPRVRREAWERSLTSYALIVDRFGYKPGDPSVFALFLCMFLHAGFGHLAGNMLFLYIFGDNIEWRLGPLGYLAAYLATGVVATLSFAMVGPDTLVPLVGASGAISGILGFYLVWFPLNQVRVFFFPFVLFVIHVRAFWVLGAYVIIDNIYYPFILGRGDNVANAAHLGGFIAGAIGAWVLNRIRGKLPSPRPGPHVERRRAPWVRKSDFINVDTRRRFHEVVASGDMREAAHLFSRHVQSEGAPPDPAAVFLLGRWLYDNGYGVDAAAIFRYYLAHYATGTDLDRVHLGLGVLLSRRLGQPVAAREHLLQAIDLARDPATAEAAREELSANR